MEYGSLLAFVKDGEHGPEEPILLAIDAFVQEVDVSGNNLDDHQIDAPPAGEEGLMIFEGWVSHTSGPDPDVFLEGGWRRLNQWELVRLRCGENPLMGWAMADRGPQ